jgi:YD repeat-containing protein
LPSGNPVLLATGNKVEVETDFSSSGEMPLTLTRSYNLHWHARGLFGGKWISSFDYRLTFGGTQAYDDCYPRPGGGVCGLGTSSTIKAWRPDGRTITYTKNVYDGVFYEDKASPISRIVTSPSGEMVLYSEDGTVETYSSAGYIISVKNEQGVGWHYSYVNGTYPHRVTHTSGRFVEFTWNGQRLVAVRDPAGNYFGYGYTDDQASTSGYHRLAATVYPGNAQTTTYHYQSFFQLIGKSINGERYSTFTYGDHGYPISSEHNGQDRYAYEYIFGSSPNERSVVETNPLGKRTTYEFRDGKLLTVTGHASALCPWSGKGNSYDANGHPDLEGFGSQTPDNGVCVGSFSQSATIRNGTGAQSNRLRVHPRPSIGVGVDRQLVASRRARPSADDRLQLHDSFQWDASDGHRGWPCQRKRGRRYKHLQRGGRPHLGEQWHWSCDELQPSHRARHPSTDRRGQR